MFCKYILLVCSLGLFFVFFLLEQAFNFNETQYINFFFYGLCFWYKFWQLCITLILMIFSDGLFYKSYIMLCLIFKFMIYFELILYKVWCWRFFFFFSDAYLVALASFAFVERTVFPSLKCLCALVENKMDIFILDCFWVLYVYSSANTTNMILWISFFRLLIWWTLLINFWLSNWPFVPRLNLTWSVMGIIHFTYC